MNTQAANIFAIASGKGGVGKTWFSITLAHTLARSGRRVLLFDGDVGLANIDVQLGLTPAKDLSGAVQGKYTLEEAITPYAEGRFDVIAGRSGTASIAALTPQALEKLAADIQQLSRNYDIVLLDLGAGIEQAVQSLAFIARTCLMVVTDEPTSLTDAYAFIKLCQQQARAPEMKIIINQAATQKEGEQTYTTLNKACMNFLKISPPLLGIIRKDNKVKESIRAQTSLIIRAPHSTAATDVAALSTKLLQA